MNVVHPYENSGGESEQLAIARVPEPEETALFALSLPSLHVLAGNFIYHIS